MFQLAHKKEPARTRAAVPNTPKAQTWTQFLFSGPEDCEPLADPEDFGKGGEDCELSVDPEVFGRGGVEVESEYDLELRIGGKVGRPGMGHFSLLTVQTVRW